MPQGFISTKGRITIPADMRKDLGWKTGTIVNITYEKPYGIFISKKR